MKRYELLEQLSSDSATAVNGGEPQASEQWQMAPFSPGDKGITLIGPTDGFYPQHIFIDFDDVNHPEVERRVSKILDALNGMDLGPPVHPDAWDEE